MGIIDGIDLKCQVPISWQIYQECKLEWEREHVISVAPIAPHDALSW